MSRVVLRRFKATTEFEIDWHELISKLLPSELPRKHGACKAILKSIFQRDLSEGVLQAASSLVGLGLENEARALLTDFLREKRGSSRIAKRLQMQLLFQERRKAMAQVPTQEISVTPNHARHESELDDQDREVDFEWASAEIEEIPLSDDSSLRASALKAQLMVSDTRAGYQVGYEEELIPGWEDINDAVVNGSLEDFETSDPNRETPDLDTQLQLRLAALGEDALALLRYFCVNPGDSVKDAAYILGYESTTDVNKLMNNRLKEYVRRHESGGWTCVDWVGRVLETMTK